MFTMCRKGISTLYRGQARASRSVYDFPLFSFQSFLQKLKTSKPLSMTGFQRFLTPNYRVNEYIEYTGGVFTWKNQQL